MKHRALLPFIFCGLATTYPAAAEEAMSVLKQEIAATPGSAPAMVARTLQAAGPQAATQAGPVTLAAIQGLGVNATSKQIAAIVYSAVHTVPDSALQIVRTAVAAAPKSAPQIAAAAALAVPNPWKEVHYQRGTPVTPPVQPTNVAMVSPGVRKERDFKEGDYKSPVDDASNSPQDPATVTDPGDPMTLAEAIVHAAIDAGGDPGAVQDAVDSVLFGDPGALFAKVSGSSSISGVGDAGDSNYANEPHPPGNPKPPVVSP